MTLGNDPSVPPLTRTFLDISPTINGFNFVSRTYYYYSRVGLPGEILRVPILPSLPISKRKKKARNDFPFGFRHNPPPPPNVRVICRHKVQVLFIDKHETTFFFSGAAVYASPVKVETLCEGKLATNRRGHINKTQGAMIFPT